MDVYYRVELRKKARGATRLETRFGIFDRTQTDESAVDTPVKVLALSLREAGQLNLDGRFDLRRTEPPSADETPVSRLLRRRRTAPQPDAASASASTAPDAPAPDAPAPEPDAPAPDALEATAAPEAAPTSDEEKTEPPPRTRRRKGKGGQE